MARSVTSKVVINQRRVRQLDKAAIKALEKTAHILQDEIRQDEVIPMENGTLKEEQFHINTSESKDGKIQLIHTTPYARRLYYHPEYHFNKEFDRNAKGKWFDQYLKGGKKQHFAKNVYAIAYRREAGT